MVIMEATCISGMKNYPSTIVDFPDLGSGFEYLRNAY
jgi:hypothetical protein